jgi:6-phosphogluconolactonase (cycloisomerase 2 family)
MPRVIPALVSAALVLSGCNPRPDSPLAPQFDREIDGAGRLGAVITMSNAVTGNEALVFPRAADGSLGSPRSYPTGGVGTGGGLGNQGAIGLSPSGRHLYLVNAGSHSISVFENRQGRIRLIQTIGSGGTEPISLAVGHRVLYALNDGAPANVTGFARGEDGRLTPIPNSTRSLSVASPDGAQVGIDAAGKTLAITEKATNRIVTFRLDGGLPAAMTVTQSSGPTPFGFELDGRGLLIVSEAFGGAPGASAVSSYRLRDGAPITISASVPTTETAACWIVITGDGRFTYTSNTASNSITGYSIDAEGRLTILNPDGVTAATGAGPIDLALSRGGGAGQFLYSLNQTDHTISIFAVGAHGALAPAGTAPGLPAGANGLVAF